MSSAVQKVLETSKQLKEQRNDAIAKVRSKTDTATKKAKKAKKSLSFRNEIPGKSLTNVQEFNQSKPVSSLTRKKRKQRPVMTAKEAADAAIATVQQRSKNKTEEERKAQENKTEEERKAQELKESSPEAKQQTDTQTEIKEKKKEEEELDDDDDIEEEENESKKPVDEEEETENNDNDPLDEEEEKPEPPSPNNRIASSIDSTLPTLLRIGTKANSEYIQLKVSSFKSKGSFNLIKFGNAESELDMFYGITPGNTDGYKAMQRAFGVKTIGNQAPLLQMVEEKCQFKGYELVKEALKKRIATLTEAAYKNDENSKNINKPINIKSKKDLIEQVQMLLTQMEDMSTWPPCPEPEESSNSTGSTGSTGCPCLEDLNLLRDLIYLVVSLQGIAHPDVKRQLESIEFEKLLQITNRKELSTQIKGALVKLQTLISEPNHLEESNAESTNELLKQIYASLGGDPSNQPSAEQVLALAKKLFEEHTTLTQQKDANTAELEALKAELAELKAASSKKPNSSQNKSTKSEQATDTTADTAVAAATAAVSTISSESNSKRCAELEATIARLEEENTKIKEQLSQLSKPSENNSAKNTKIKELEEELAKTKAERNSALGEAANTKNVEAEKTELNNRIAALEKEKKECDEKVQELQSKLTAAEAASTSTSEQTKLIEDLTKEKLEAEAAKKECDTKLAALEAELDAANQEKGATDMKLAALEAELAKAKAALETADAEKNELESKLNATSDEHKRTKSEIESKLADAEQKVVDCTKEVERLINELENIKVAALESNLKHTEELKALQARIAQLEAELAKAKGEASTKDSELEAAKAALEQANKDLLAAQEKQKKCDETVAQLTAKLSTLDELTSKSGDQTQQLDTLTSELKQAKDEAAAAQAEKAAAESKATTAQAAATAAEAEKTKCDEELQQVKAELQQIKSESLAKNVSISAKDAIIADQTRQIEELKKQLESQKEETRKRLQQLLSWILVSPTEIDTVSKWFTSDTKEGEEEAKAVFNKQKTLSEGSCQMLLYFKDLIDIQMAKIRSLYPNSDLKDDIFLIFRDKTYTYDPDTMLKEISLLFQTIFTDLKESTKLTEEIFTVPLKGKYPVLSTFIDFNFESKLAGVKLQAAKIDSKSNDILSFTSILLENKENNTIKLLKEGVNDIKQDSKFIPLSLLAIKMIQLLHQKFNEKYGTLQAQCSSTKI